VGIDLGTTHSLVARVVGGKPECMPADDEGGRLLPSVVHFDPQTGLPTVGKAAKELAARFPKDTIVSVKRFMGRNLADLDVRARGPYEFAEEGSVPRFLAGGKAVTAVEVSAEILKGLRRRAEGFLQEKLERAVITVPAYFDDAQRQATKDAGRLAGIEVLRIINEPTAAALAYGLDKQVNGKFAVYDLGGGTFDVSILALDSGVFQVLATKGDTALGGDDFDRAIVRFVLEKKLGRPVDWSQDVGEGQRALLYAARAAKERLTTAESAEVEGVTLTRDDFEQLSEVKQLVERTIRIARLAMMDAKLKPSDLDGIVLVGGMTRVPLVRREVEAFFGRPPLADIDPDQVVALGAAVQADLLAGAGPRDDVLLLDVTPLSLGLETMGGVVEKLVPRNSTVPTSAAQVFTTFKDGQNAMDVHVLQGERELVQDCRSLARFRLSKIPPLAAGLARIQVTFAIDADGILHVSAKELSTGVEQSITVKPSHGLTDEEVERMLIDSIDHAEEDVARRLLQESRVEAERILNEARKRVADHAFLLQPGEKEHLVAAMAELSGAVQGEDYKRVLARQQELIVASNPFAERVMDYEIDRAVKGRNAEDLALATEAADSVGMKHLREQMQKESAVSDLPSTRKADS
ncbi:MAG: Fe-S protein assembly chaperone HscA, partial [Deltaproteobacteria bacterium]|nr:Fe-S protein assembly chaperone HscA [Deltaproteobacteria bacterium]